MDDSPPPVRATPPSLGVHVAPDSARPLLSCKAVKPHADDSLAFMIPLALAIPLPPPKTERETWPDAWDALSPRDPRGLERAWERTLQDLPPHRRTALRRALTRLANALADARRVDG